MTLIGVIHMYMGATARVFFEEEKAALLQQIDAEIEKVNCQCQCVAELNSMKSCFIFAERWLQTAPTHSRSGHARSRWRWRRERRRRRGR